MNVLSSLISRTVQFFLGGVLERRNRAVAKEKEAGIFEHEISKKSRDFEEDYNAAVSILRSRIDKKFPDNYYARLRSDTSTSYDHGEDRARAVDTMSTAIALALRDGATVQQAAEAGAASVGI